MPNSYLEKSFFLDLGIGIGGAFYPLKHIGIFYEYQWGDFAYYYNQYYKLGLIYKFRKRK